jgi:hypothetical protein
MAFLASSAAGSWSWRAPQRSRAGFIAALLLLAVPNYYGQMFLGHSLRGRDGLVDLPMVRIIPLLPRPKWSLVAKLGVAIAAL